MLRPVLGAVAKVAAKAAPKRPAVTLPPLKWVRSPNQSHRSGSVRMVVLHDTEGNYDGAISWFRNPNAQVSAHLVLREDGGEATQMVAYGEKAWHCMAYNSASIGLEMAGIASKGFGSSELRHAARMVAFLLHKHSLPPVYLTGSKVDSGRGFTLHQNLGQAGGGHHDPGFTPTKAKWFATLVAYEYHRGGFRPQYGVERDPAV